MPRHAHGVAHDAGQGLIEYALILGLTSLGIVLALLVLRNSIGNPMQGSSNRIEAAGLVPPGQPLAGEPAGAAGGVPGSATDPPGGYDHGHGNSGHGNGNGNGRPNGGSNGHSGDGNSGNGNGGPR